MEDKKKAIMPLLAIVSVIAAIFVCTNCVKNSESQYAEQNIQQENVQSSVKIKSEKISEKISKKKIKNASAVQTVKTAAITKEDYKTKKADLYATMPSSALPLSAVNIISDLPENIQKSVAETVDSSNGVFMLKRDNDRLLMVVDNQTNIRHNIEFVEISLKNGHKTRTTLGYNDRMNDFSNEIWEYDKKTKQPTKNTMFDEDGDIAFVEHWNYDESNPIKYEMKDEDGKVITMKKEILDDDTNLRVEHLVYDDDGNTKVSVTTTYDGADVKRFTYYNAEKPSDGASIIGEYSDGLKTKETVYSTDLKLKNTYTADYNNGIREDIKIYNDKNQEIGQIVGK